MATSGKRITNRNCALYETDACVALNMRACKSCPVPGGDAAVILEDITLFESLLPEGGVSHLFASPTCQLCRGAGRERSGFAILDMGHSEPKRLQRKSILLPKGVTGFMVPLQFACCNACRRRLLILNYLPLLSSIVLTGATVALCMNEAVGMRLRAIDSALPLFVVAGAMILGWVGGLIAARYLRKAYNRDMYVDALRHPTAKAMVEKGWFPIMGGKRAKLVLTKKRITRGLGTARWKSH
ncbi:MAG: hypothetical protein FWE69_07070 [Clostridiales bacterium]|nr:hypothetical protein [Clostridiales bacterium]